MTGADLQEAIERCFAAGADAVGDPTSKRLSPDTAALERAKTCNDRLLHRDGQPAGWRVNAWVKQGILLGFRISALEDDAGQFRAFFCQQEHLPGASLRCGGRRTHRSRGLTFEPEAFVARGVVCMPPMYINVGAWVDEGTMVDSHALVGSCAQIGKRVHLSAAAQIGGGLLEPVNASPVIIEDDALVGGNCGVYEGTIVRRGAVLASGTILTRGTPVFDLVHGTILRAGQEQPLIIPENAVVVPGSRAVSKGKGQEWGLSIYAPVIVKYRDEKTDLSATLEDLLR